VQQMLLLGLRVFMARPKFTLLWFHVERDVSRIIYGLSNSHDTLSHANGAMEDGLAHKASHGNHAPVT
jgi:hypothetical protein